MSSTEAAMQDAPARRRLDIRLSGANEPPSPEHELLLGFHFGVPRSQADDQAVVGLALQPLDRARLFESWWYRGTVRRYTAGPVRIAECDDYAAAILEVDDRGGGDVGETASRAYEQLIEALRATAHPRIVKVWNYLGGITRGDGDDERYRQFSVGRTRAFRKFGIEPREAPTGTAIGTSDASGLSLIALASSRNVGLAENPRQVSAFHYPRQYGPSSPRFSRGGVIATDTERLFLISGTAAVVGHESAHPWDTARQTDEMLRNLELLCGVIAGLDPRGPRQVLRSDSALRVYLREPDDRERVGNRLDAMFGDRRPRIAFLCGEICRRELMVEIDGATVADG